MFDKTLGKITPETSAMNTRAKGVSNRAFVGVHYCDDDVRISSRKRRRCQFALFKPETISLHLSRKQLM